MTKVVILGAAGRMGRALARCAASMNGVEVVGATEAAGCFAVGEDVGLLGGIGARGVAVTDDLRAAAATADVLIDFTFHTFVADHARTAAELGLPIVIGTTGLDADETAAVHDSAATVPVFWAPNMSLGVNLLFALVKRAAATLGTDYDIEIVETHHRRKADAPSGTALRLGESAAAGREVALDDVAVYGRHGLGDERPRGEIALHSLRGGDVVGDHTVNFIGETERVELTHRAASRDVFAAGALRAAMWVRDKEPALYDMQDLLGLR